jgi:CHAD domain-containing protein
MAKAADIEGLDCAGAAHDGIALTLRTRLAEMCALSAAALDWSDAEGVHDMRVASRRLRSAVRDFAPYLRGRLPRTRLRQLAATLGEVRDDDVALLALEEIARAAEPETAAGLDHLLAELRARREHARDLLSLALEASALAALQKKFLRRLERVNHKARADAQTFRAVGREIVLARLEELLADGQALYRPHAKRRLHQLRIEAKRLRYALELFAQCWGEQLTAAAGEVAELQKSLGELHDCDVWIAELGERLERQAQADDRTEVSEDARRVRRANVWLLERFVKDRGRHYRAALARWEDWAATDFTTRLRAAFSQTDSPAMPENILLTPSPADTDGSS